MLTDVKPSLSTTKTRHLKHNDRLFLNDANCIWRVSSGAIDLFALHQGRRRYLFSIKPNEVLFPISVSEEYLTCQLFAQASQPTTLSALTDEQFYEWVREDNATAIAAIESWIISLSNIASTVAPQVLPIPISDCGILAIEEVFQPPQGQVSWVRLYQGEATLLGETDLMITPSCEWVPLSGSLWLQATHLVELERRQHRQLEDSHGLLQGVLQLQQLVGHLLATQLEQAQQEELLRLHQREVINQEALAKTNAEFVKVFAAPQRRQSQILPPLAKDFDTALLSVTGGVGKALGVPINPPGASEDRRCLGNPLEAIARASHLQIRAVSLRDDWWTKDCGPLVSYTLADGAPVALLPVGESAYEVYNPMTPSRTRCDRALAKQLSTTAYTFYRSLPSVLRPIDLLQFATRGRVKELVIRIVGK